MVKGVFRKQNIQYSNAFVPTSDLLLKITEITEGRQIGCITYFTKAYALASSSQKFLCFHALFFLNVVAQVEMFMTSTLCCFAGCQEYSAHNGIIWSIYSY